MKLILTQEVTGLGAPGDVVEVKDGYGRNFLVPRGLALRWTRGGEKQIVQIKLANPRIAADLETYLRRLMLNRRPSKEVLQTALRRLGADIYLFSGDRETLLRDIEAKLK